MREQKKREEEREKMQVVWEEMEREGGREEGSMQREGECHGDREGTERYE